MHGLKQSNKQGDQSFISILIDRFRFNEKMNYSIEMKSNFGWPPVTQADNAWVEYATPPTK